MTGVALVSIFAVLLAGRIPIAFALGISTLAFLLVFEPNVNLGTLPQKMFAGADSFTLTAIPFFVLAGEIMSRGGISKRLVGFAHTLVGHRRGGMGIVELVASAFFASFSGSSIANSAGTGSITIPAMRRSGYPKGMAAAVETSSSSLGAIIPPSIPMVVYGGIAGVSIGGLFVGGYVPALAFGIGLAIVIRRVSIRLGLPVEVRSTARERLQSARESLPALLLPVVIMGGILSGMVTPTEAGALGVVYAFVVSFFVYRELTLKDMPQVLINTAITTGVVMLVMTIANAFGWILAFEQIPTQLATLFTANITQSWLLMLVIVVLLMIIGMVLDTVAAIIVLTPVLVPIASTAGIDPLFLGVIVTIALSLGVATPPVGVCLFVTARIAETTIEDVSRAIMPFLAVLIGLLALMALAPDVILFLPRLFGF
ncbi:TRAP transporter large permease [Blastococcus sp. CT_GayMR20]|uniref:TRAP transporter large permease n=1 Tax=Blastococcus sp. CT_GayMR20 TaxID=2559609 RepID=UPI0010739064|nr:TRAP transporter large permease [Blastococcus sp. CT_GayMR20]TFV70581.1 TRAP transporter large permease [Blastococcus sp. CT_GayMR20]